MTLPVIGAALPLSALETYRDWLIEKQRDLELQSFHMPDVLDGDWQPQVDEALKLLDGYEGRLGIHGPYSGLNVGSPDPLIQQAVAQRMDQGLDICAALGAVQMVIHSPFTAWDHQNFRNFRNSRDRIIESTHTTLDAAVARAADQGVTLVLENIWDVDPDERRRLVESFGSEALKLSVDTGHAHISNRHNGAEPVDYFIQSAGDLLAHVHLQDTDGYSDRHWAVGEGTIRWQQVFRALADLEVQPHLVFELKDKNGIPASLAFLEELGLAQ